MKKVRIIITAILMFAVTLSVQAADINYIADNLGILRGSISSRHIKNNSIKGKDIKDRTIESRDIKNGTIKGKDIKDGSIEAEDLEEGILGGVSDNSVTSGKIVDGTITNADISGTAAITYGKLNLANSIVTGDIANGTIADADISGTAAIAYSKLSLANSIVTGDITDGTIVNADISGTAAIDYSKLNLTNSIVSGDIFDGTIATIDIADNAVTDPKVVNALTIDGGTVDNTPVGSTGASSGAFTTLSSSGAATLDSLGVTNNATVGGALGITGITTMVGNLNADGGLDVDNAFVVADGGALTTSQAATFNNDLNAYGTDIRLGNATTDTVYVVANMDIMNGTRLQSYGSTYVGNGDGEAIEIGSTGGGDNVVLTDDQWSISGAGAANFASIGAVTPGSGAFTTLSSSGAATLNSLGVTNNANVGGTLGVTGITTLIGNLNASGGLNVDGAFVVADGGALTTSQLATFNANVNADGGLDVDNAFVVADGGALTTSQVATLNGTLNANGSVNLGNGSGDTIVIGGGGADNVTISDAQWSIDGATGDASFAAGTFSATLAADSNLDLRDAGAVSGGMIYDGTDDLGDDEIILGDGIDDTIIASGNLEPDTGSENLGASATRWSTIFADTLNYSTAITDANVGGTTVSLGDDNAADTVAIVANTSISDAQWGVTAAGAASFSGLTSAGLISTGGADLQGGPLDLSSGSYLANPLAGHFVFGDSATAAITLDFAGNAGNTNVTIADTVGTGTVILGDADSNVTVANNLTVGGTTVTLPANSIVDGEVSDTLTSSIFVGTGSTTNAIDLATAEVNGTLADANVSDALTIDGGTIGGVTPAAGTFSDLAAGNSLSLPGKTTLPGTCVMGDLLVDTDSDDCIDTAAGDGALCVCDNTGAAWILLTDL